MSEIERPVCRTCLRPAEPLIDEGGVLFCHDCHTRYKDLLDWMAGDSGNTVSYERFMAEYQVPYSPNPLEAHLERERQKFADWMVGDDYHAPPQMVRSSVNGDMVVDCPRPKRPSE